MLNSTLSDITALLCKIGNLVRLEADEDFYDAGFSSIRALELLLELESAYSVSIPDGIFVSARTSRALAQIVHDLSVEGVT